MIFCRTVIYVIAFILTLGASVGSATAQNSESLDRLFTIKAVSVDVVASRASEARRLALAQAEQEAYQKLLRKITQPEGREKLPELSPGEIQTLISGIEVVEEQSSSRRYLAQLDIRFEPGNVSGFLAQHGVPHVLGTGRGLIVLHAHSDGLTNYVWQPKESTLNARASVDWLNRIRNYVFPRGELRERAQISYNEINAFRTDNVSAVARLYNVQSALLISSSWYPAKGQGGTLSYRFYSTDGDWQRDGQLAVTGENSEEEAQRQMFELVLEEIDTAWRDQLLVDTGTAGELSVLVPSTEFEVLTKVESRLSDVSLVRSFSLKEIGLPFSRIEFQYTGRKDQLVMALRYAGLDLENYGSDHILKIRPEN